MTPCADLEPMSGNTMGDLLTASINTVNAYSTCNLKLYSLQKWVASNN